MEKIKFSNKKVIEFQDWDELVRETYKRPYCFQQQDGCMSRGTFDFEVPNKWGVEDYENDTIPEKVNGSEMGVSFKAWLERDPNLDVFDNSFSNNLFWGRNFYPSVDMIIEDLHKKGLIDEGEYSININW